VKKILSFDDITEKEKKDIEDELIGISEGTLKITPSINWMQMPMKEYVRRGLSETILLQAYETMYLVFEENKDLDNAANALYYGSKVSKVKDGLFYMLLDSLGIKGENPTLEYIREVLRKNFRS
jgi:hypothetical protein